MNYHEISPEMTIGDLVKSNVYGDFANYIFTDMTPDHWNCPLKDYGYEKVGFEQTLHRMEELASTKDQYVYHIYDEETRLSQWDKEKPVLLHFPGPDANLPYAVVIPGGGFNRQWGLIEGMAIAAPANAAVLRNPRRLISILLFSSMILCFMHYNLMNGKCPVH